MAYQTNSGEFFDYLNHMLTQNQISETIQILSDASSTDPTLNGDLKFLKLRANKKLMVPAGATGGSSKDQIQDVIKLVAELKKAHARRDVAVYTLTEPSKKVMKNIPSSGSVKTKKKRSALPWVLLFLLLGASAAGYFFRDKIKEIGFVKNLLSEDEPTENNEASLGVANTKEKPKKKTRPRTSPPPKKKESESTPPPKSSASQLKSDLGSWYIQVASYGKLNQALTKQERVAMSFDRSIVLQKNLGGSPNFRVIIPGFKSKSNAEAFLAQRKVKSLYTGAFTRDFSTDCARPSEEDSSIYICD